MTVPFILAEGRDSINVKMKRSRSRPPSPFPRSTDVRVTGASLLALLRRPSLQEAVTEELQKATYTSLFFFFLFSFLFFLLKFSNLSLKGLQTFTEGSNLIKVPLNWFRVIKRHSTGMDDEQQVSQFAFIDYKK